MIARAIMTPSQVNAIPPITDARIYPKAAPIFEENISMTVSSPNAEKVVNPPSNPAMIKFLNIKKDYMYWFTGYLNIKTVEMKLLLITILMAR